MRPEEVQAHAQKRLCQKVSRKLGENWSPEQIAGWLARKHPDDPDLQVSHETIYRTLFVQSRGALKKELVCGCRWLLMSHRALLISTSNKHLHRSNPAAP